MLDITSSKRQMTDGERQTANDGRQTEESILYNKRQMVKYIPTAV